MTNNKKFPPIPKVLLEELERRFPDVCPEPDLTLDQIRFKQGQVSIIRFLRSTFDFQNQNILENK
jgi:hypothetical protein